MNGRQVESMLDSGWRICVYDDPEIRPEMLRTRRLDNGAISVEKHQITADDVIDVRRLLTLESRFRVGNRVTHCIYRRCKSAI